MERVALQPLPEFSPLRDVSKVPDSTRERLVPTPVPVVVQESGEGKGSKEVVKRKCRIDERNL